MKKSISKIKKFIKNSSGATAIEYGLIAALISVVIILAVGFVGGQVKTTFSKVGSTLGSANAVGAAAAAG